MNARRKGAEGERELAEFLRGLGFEAIRGQQRSGVEQADVVGGPPGVHFECKRVEALNVWAAMEQAERDAPAGTVPVVAMRRNRTPWLAVVRLDVLVELTRDRGLEKALERLAARRLLE